MHVTMLNDDPPQPTIPAPEDAMALCVERPCFKAFPLLTAGRGYIAQSHNRRPRLPRPLLRPKNAVRRVMAKATPSPTHVKGPIGATPQRHTYTTRRTALT